MTYRDDLEALAARQASLQADVDRKQRELADVRGMLAEARRVEQAESELDRAPDLRRHARRQLAIGALLVTLGTGAGVGAAATTDASSSETASAEVRGMLVRVRTTRHSLQQAERRRAEFEALRALGLIPVLDEDGRPIGLERRTRRVPAWTLGPAVPAMGSPWDRVARTAGSPAREDER